MYSKAQLAKKYISWYINASNGKGHGIHSPFVYDFVRHVLIDKRTFYAYEKVEGLREELLKNPTVLEVEDFGAGSSIDKTNQRSIFSITKNAAKPKKLAQLLFRIAQYYKPQHILELGTSMGISTAYLALGSPQARVITAEGSTTIAEQARSNFRKLQLENIEQVIGNFDDTLPAVLQAMPQTDLAFIDGNHRLQPTLRYFNQLLTTTHNSSILIFDDIHWSPEMEQAWQTIKEHDTVRQTIDLFFIGMVLFRDEFKIKQHFSIRF